MTRRTSPVAVCCSNASVRLRSRACSSRRSSLFSRLSLALVSLREGRRGFDVDFLAVGIRSPILDFGLPILD